VAAVPIVSQKKKKKDSRMGEKRKVYRILGGNPEGKRPLGRLDVGGWIILKRILEG
jgi:hypothetical protein